MHRFLFTKILSLIFVLSCVSLVRAEQTQLTLLQPASIQSTNGTSGARAQNGENTPVVIVAEVTPLPRANAEKKPHVSSVWDSSQREPFVFGAALLNGELPSRTAGIPEFALPVAPRPARIIGNPYEQVVIRRTETMGLWLSVRSPVEAPTTQRVVDTPQSSRRLRVASQEGNAVR